MNAQIDQSGVQQWFNEVYSNRGLNYLRPPEAYPIFIQLLKPRPSQRLLDVACGPGLLLKAAREKGMEAMGVDLSSVAVGMVPNVAPGASAQVGNSENLPFTDGEFDFVTCIGSIERFLNREKALGEMIRVGKPGARYCFMVRNAETLGWKVAIELMSRRNVKGHQDADTLESWSDLLSKCGFKVEQILPDQWFWQKLRNKFRPYKASQSESIARGFLPLRFANEFIFVCSKTGK